MKKVKTVFVLILAAAAFCVIVWLTSFFAGVTTIAELLTENKSLKQALANLTTPQQIGYAKVIDQQTRDGKSITTIKFVETAGEDNFKKIFEKDYTIEGDVIHFDALVVKFDNKLVQDGKQRSLYLWRRIYGEKMPPESGLPIDSAGAEPLRYKEIFRLVPVRQQELFWSAVWDLANNPDGLKQYGITAIYGNVVYSRVRPGFIYVFKMTATGQLYPEIIPDI
jgi:hypothetical protein